ncbi:MAG: T9SS type A sorting domain-containing protein [Flavobacteriales bacterium]|nr:T9SS type A sorting domain-containing protein [Flavobacteriales bacterium]
MGGKLLTLFCLSFVLLSVNDSSAQLYSNGLLATGTVATDGFAAPTGYSWSELQNNTGNNSQVNGTAGLPGYYYADGSLNYALADDFIVPEGQVWSVTSFDFFCYEPIYSGSVPPINQLKIRLYNSDPSLPSSTLISGDLTTNVYDAANSENAFIYRIFNATVPSPQQPNFSRKVFRVRGNLNATLPAGHYWVEFQVHATDNTEIFFPPVTVVGSRSVAGANSKINVIASFFPSDVLGWGTNTDIGIPNSAPDVALALPFIVNGTSTLSLEDYVYKDEVTIAPNPVIDFLNLSSANDIMSIEIYNMLGQQVLIKEINKTEVKIDVSQLKQGTYLIKVLSDNQQKTLKIVKE